MSKTLTLKQKKAIVNYLLTEVGKGIFEDDDQGLWPDIDEGDNYAEYRDAVEAFGLQLKREALRSLKPEEVAKSGVETLKWKKMDDNHYRSGDYVIICESLRGKKGHWSAFFRAFEFRVPSKSPRASLEEAKAACKQHANLRVGPHAV